MLLLAADSEKLDGLTSYFSRSALSCDSRRVANPLAELPRDVRALVVFPDEFAAHEISTYLALVGARRPDLTLVIVTRDPASYVERRATDGRPLRTRVLSWPALGRTILEEVVAALA